MAQADNWNDLNQYNQVWKGQLGNLFDEATFTPAVDMYNSNASIAGLNALNTAANTYVNFANLPGTLTQTAVNGAYAGPLANVMKQAQMRMAGQFGQGGGMFGGMGGIDPAVFQEFLNWYRNKQAQAPSGVQ
jgi:hypothetical protein